MAGGYPASCARSQSSPFLHPILAGLEGIPADSNGRAMVGGVRGERWCRTPGHSAQSSAKESMTRVSVRRPHLCLASAVSRQLFETPQTQGLCFPSGESLPLSEIRTREHTISDVHFPVSGYGGVPKRVYDRDDPAKTTNLSTSLDTSLPSLRWAVADVGSRTTRIRQSWLASSQRTVHRSAHAVWLPFDVGLGRGFGEVRPPATASTDLMFVSRFGERGGGLSNKYKERIGRGVRYCGHRRHSLFGVRLAPYEYYAHVWSTKWSQPDDVRLPYFPNASVPNKLTMKFVFLLASHEERNLVAVDQYCHIYRIVTDGSRKAVEVSIWITLKQQSNFHYRCGR
ncbi:hypothetical protein DFH06DRAFT_1146990 [Mycena polygramma]|nr:hypothetical protein DFH06DRAFT_1146990 [Mycena polygramma]